MLPIKLELPEHFLDEEIRCGYTVTKEMKKIWAVELDLLNELRKVCEQYDLKYYMSAGSLLGTIRHHGYIPWDDDIDVVMLREDYDKLVSIAPRAFLDPYDFMVSGKIDHYFRGHSQLRNRLTTGILRSELAQKHNFDQGIWIDIFVLDGVPEQDKEKRLLYFKLNLMKRCLGNRARNAHERLSARLLHRFLLCWEKITGDNFQRASDRYENECRRLNNKYTEYVSVIEFRCPPLRKYRREIYAESIEMPFEFLGVSVMKEYDSYLTKRYRDYMKPAQEPSMHGKIIVDPEKPYTEYLK